MADVVVSVGSDHHPFDRLMDWIDDAAASDGIDGMDITWFVQRGTSKAPSRVRSVAFTSRDELLAAFGAARAIVLQGGPGGIFEAIGFGKVPVVVPRRKALGECVDDHQVLFVERLARAGRVHLARSSEELAGLLARAIGGDPAFAAEPSNAAPPAGVAAFERELRTLLGTSSR